MITKAKFEVSDTVVASDHNNLVSIMIPVYNRKAHIAECIDSALSQTVANIEIVIIDNASDDGTWEICMEYASRDKRIRIFQNEVNIGPVRNWKRCFDEAQGKYGKLLFSDDLIYPAFLEKTLPFLEDPEVGFVVTVVEVGETSGRNANLYKCRWGEKSGKLAGEQYLEAALKSEDVSVSPGSALFRLCDMRENLLADIPSPTLTGFASHGAGPDLLLYLLTAAKYPLVAQVDSPLSFFRVHGGSISFDDRDSRLAECYCQARVWFASTKYENQFVAAVLVRAWLVLTLREKKWMSLSVFSQRYLYTPFQLGLFELAALVFSEVSLRVAGYAHRRREC